MKWWIIAIIIFVIVLILLRLIFGRAERNAEKLSIRKMEEGLGSNIVIPDESEASQTSYSPYETKKSPAHKNEPTDISMESIPSRISMSERSIFTADELEDFYRCKNPFVGKGSIKERICREFLRKYFNLPFQSCRPEFIFNPETNRALELDCYEGSLRLAVEFQGIHHYQYTPYLHPKGMEDFINMKRRDKLKAELCSRFGIYLIRVPHTIPNNQIGEFIEARLPKNLRK